MLWPMNVVRHSAFYVNKSGNSWKKIDNQSVPNQCKVSTYFIILEIEMGQIFYASSVNCLQY